MENKVIAAILSDIEQTGYSFVPDLISSEELKVIHNFYNEHRAEFKPALIGPHNSKVRDESIRGDFTFWLDPIAPLSEFKSIMTFLESLRENFNSHFFLGLKQFECHLAYYPSGTFYKKHSDKFESQSSRSVSFVFYMNQDWTEEDGGELVIYDKNNNHLKTIYPRPGSFICFLSDEFPHEVKSASRERRSLTGWMHTKIIY